MKKLISPDDHIFIAIASEWWEVLYSEFLKRLVMVKVKWWFIYAPTRKELDLSDYSSVRIGLKSSIQLL